MAGGAGPWCSSAADNVADSPLFHKDEYESAGHRERERERRGRAGSERERVGLGDTRDGRRDRADDGSDEDDKCVAVRVLTMANESTEEEQRGEKRGRERSGKEEEREEKQTQLTKEELLILRVETQQMLHHHVL